MNRILDAALRYAANGIYVFPVTVERSNTDKKIVTPIDAWPSASTVDPDAIKQWFKAGGSWEHASLAIDTGKSKLVVIDCDIKGDKDGIVEWEKLVNEHGIPPTANATTPGGGQHHYYRADPNRPVRNTQSVLAPRIDTRGVGGFAFASPSKDWRGSYQWVHDSEGHWGMLPTVPEVVINLKQSAKSVTHAIGEARTFTHEQAEIFCAPYLEKLRNAFDGEINSTLNTAAKVFSHFVPDFWSQEDAQDLLLDALSHTEYDGQTWHAETTIDSAFTSTEAKSDWKAALVEDSGQEMGPTARQAREGRPELHIGSPAICAEWLKENIGKGPLSGMFNKFGDIVHTPREGEDGYIPLNEDRRGTDGPVQVRRVIAEGLVARIQYGYFCYRENSKGKYAAMFPMAASRIAVAVPDMLLNLRNLRGVIHSPLIRKDGTILSAPGYDEATKLLHLPEPGLLVPEVSASPTSQEVMQAVELLDYMTAGFDFLTEHDRANYFGLLMTPLLREMVPPPYKLGAIGAPQPGSGKSLLALIPRILYGGVFRAEMPENDAELRKQITSILEVTTAPVVQFDNVSGVLRSSVLAGLLTSPTWDDRPLGRTDTVRCFNDRLWVITGNNLALGGDLVRRTLWVTIDPRVPSPHLRTDFAIRNLDQWVHEHRGQLLHALLTLIRAWVIAGKATVLRGNDGFARWIEAVDGILTNAGVPGTFAHADSVKQGIGTDDAEWSEFLEAVYREFKDHTWTVKELLVRVRHTLGADDPSEQFDTEPIPLDALPSELTEKTLRANVGPPAIARTLGKWLSNREGRWAGNYCVRRAGTERSNIVRWRVDVG